MKDGNVRILYEEEGTVQQDSIFRENNSELHPFISYNTLKLYYCIPFQNIGALICFSSTIDENPDTVHLIEEFVF